MKRLRLLLGFMFVVGAVVASPFATADIISISNPGSTCKTTGYNDLCPSSTTPYSLTALLSGNIGFLVQDVNGAGSWIVKNDTGDHLSSLTLWYSGTLNNNHNLTLHVDGWNAATKPFSNCTITDSASTPNVTSGCSVNTLKPQEGFILPAQLVWHQGTGFGIPDGAWFDLKISSFDVSHLDRGCISGTANCQPVPPPVPEPASLLLFAMGLLSGAAGIRRIGYKK
jgi:PEP-CTERM motif